MLAPPRQTRAPAPPRPLPPPRRQRLRPLCSGSRTGSQRRAPRWRMTLGLPRGLSALSRHRQCGSNAGRAAQRQRACRPTCRSARTSRVRAEPGTAMRRRRTLQRQACRPGCLRLRTGTRTGVPCPGPQECVARRPAARRRPTLQRCPALHPLTRQGRAEHSGAARQRRRCRWTAAQRRALRGSGAQRRPACRQSGRRRRALQRSLQQRRACRPSLPARPSPRPWLGKGALSGQRRPMPHVSMPGPPAPGLVLPASSRSQAWRQALRPSRQLRR